MSPQDKAFYQALGQRIARLRKAQGLTQQQLAERLGVSQQTLAHYEVARLRVAVSILPALAELLPGSLDELIDEAPKRTNGERGPTPKLQRQLERISTLPRAKQRFVMEMLDTVIQQAS